MPFMLSAANKPFMLSVLVQNVVMLSVVLLSVMVPKLELIVTSSLSVHSMKKND